MDCPYCGYNTSPGDMPRSKKSLRRIASDRKEDTEGGNGTAQAEDD